MATIVTRANGTREVRYIAADGKRPTIRIGRCSQKTADEVLEHVERILEARRLDQPIRQRTADWLKSIGDELHARLVRGGLCAPRVVEGSGSVPLRKLFDDYIARRTDLKPGTVLVLQQARNHVAKHFGDTRDARTINVGEAKDFRRAMAADYSEAYTGKVIRQARQVWKDAIDRHTLTDSPWAAVRCGSSKNPKRQFFIDRPTIDAIIEEAPDPQWKLIIALSRYAGLRCPSEHLRLKWEDIDWAKDRMTIHAKKTEHHMDEGIRVIPIFPEIRPYLQTVFDQAADGQAYVITRYRDTNANLRTTFMKYIKRAGFTPWPRLFHNLRSSCQTELADRFPGHVVCKWIGNSEDIAKAHYLQVHEEHFQLATKSAPESAPANGVESGNAGNMLIYCTVTQGEKPENAETPAKAGVSGWAHRDSNQPTSAGNSEPSVQRAPESAPPDFSTLRRQIAIVRSNALRIHPRPLKLIRKLNEAMALAEKSGVPA